MILINYKKIYYCLISILIITIDQLFKFLIINNYRSIINTDLIFFNLIYVKNYGAAFNLFEGNRIFLSLISILISIILLLFILKKSYTYKLDLLSYSFILGGTLGNGLDRILKGYVIDFINLKFINFPVFNIADMFINIGFVLLLYRIFKERK